MFDTRIGEHPLHIILAHHEDGSDEEGQDAEGEELLPRQIPETGSVHHLHGAQDSEEGDTGQAAGKQGADHPRCFAISVRLPAVQRRQSHLGAEPDEQEDKAGPQPGGRKGRTFGKEVVKLQGHFDSSRQRRICKKEHAEQGEGNTDRTDQEIFPGGFD